MKHLLLSVILSVLFVVSCARKDNTVTENNGIKTIKINVDGCEKDMDISDMFDTSFFRIVPLETTPECIIGGQIKNVFYRNGRVYVVEEMAKGVFVFDDNGKFLSKIQSFGGGPEEYFEITSVRITDDRIVILDQMGRKVLFYDMDCNYIGRIENRGEYPAHGMFTAGDRIYYTYGLTVDRPGYGTYRLCSTDMDGRDLQKHIPFDTATVWPTVYGVHNLYTDIGGRVKFVYPSTDTVYSAGIDGVRAEYVMDFGDKALPESFRDDIRESSKPENLKKYIRGGGVSQMIETKNMLVFSFMYGTLPKFSPEQMDLETDNDPEKAKVWMRTKWPTTLYHAFYDKNTGETTVTNGLSMSYFDKYRIDFRYYDYPYVIFSRNVDAYDTKKTAVDAIKIPQNPRYEKKYKEVVAGIKEGDNPIVFVYKLKR